MRAMICGIHVGDRADASSKSFVRAYDATLLDGARRTGIVNSLPLITVLT